jgi:hypothetical protein
MQKKMDIEDIIELYMDDPDILDCLKRLKSLMDILTIN